MDEPRSGYSRIAIALHWTIAVLILFQIGLGWRMGAQHGLAEFESFQLHKSIGFTILFVSLARLAWRLTHWPPSHANQARWERIAAASVHGAFYVIMIGLPLTGWVMVSTSRIDIPTLLYHVVPWPHLPVLHTLSPGPKATWNEAASVGHESLIWITIALLVLHLGAVAKHQFLDRDRVFANMAPGATAGWTEPRLWLAGAVGVALFGWGWGAFGGGRQASPKPVAPEPVIAVEPTQVEAPAHAAVAPAGQPDAAKPPSEDKAAQAQTASTEAATADSTSSKPIDWIVTKGNSTLDFTASWSGQPINGRFAKWDGEIAFSPDALPASHLRITVDLASVSTGDAQRDATLPTSDWFDAVAHPHAVFVADKIKETSKGHYRASGSLDMRGVHRPLALDFTVSIDGKRATARGEAVIDRTVFGVGQGEWAATDQIAADVKVRFKVSAERQ